MHYLDSNTDLKEGDNGPGNNEDGRPRTDWANMAAIYDRQFQARGYVLWRIGTYYI